MSTLIMSFFVMFLVVLIFTLFLTGGQASTKDREQPTIACPPGFSPSLVYVDSYGGTSVAYDEHQQAIYLIKPDGQPPLLVPRHNILASAFFEDNTLIAKSLRSDEEGKQLLAHLVTEDIQVMFQDQQDQLKISEETGGRGLCSGIDLKILINDRDQPVYTINFLNMEAKRGGLIYNEAIGYGKTWQNILSFLIRQAGKNGKMTGPSVSQQQPTLAAV